MISPTWAKEPPLTASCEATNVASSSWLDPLRIGTLANRPPAIAVPTDSVRTFPSTYPGMAKNGNLLTSSVADACRRKAADWSSPSSESANATPAASA